MHPKALTAAHLLAKMVAVSISIKAEESFPLPTLIVSPRDPLHRSFCITYTIVAFRERLWLYSQISSAKGLSSAGKKLIKIGIVVHGKNPPRVYKTGK